MALLKTHEATIAEQARRIEKLQRALELDPAKTTGFMYMQDGARDAQSRVTELEKLIHWMAQTVHQGHHTEQPKTWRECPRGFCSSVRHWLGAAAAEAERLTVTDIARAAGVEEESDG